MPNKADDKFNEQETRQRLDAILRGAFSGPPKTYEESKVGKAKRKRAKSPAKRETKRDGT